MEVEGKIKAKKPSTCENDKVQTAHTWYWDSGAGSQVCISQVYISQGCHSSALRVRTQPCPQQPSLSSESTAGVWFTGEWAQNRDAWYRNQRSQFHTLPRHFQSPPGSLGEIVQLQLWIKCSGPCSSAPSVQPAWHDADTHGNISFFQLKSHLSSLNTTPIITGKNRPPLERRHSLNGFW